jgi:hypothetical protein
MIKKVISIKNYSHLIMKCKRILLLIYDIAIIQLMSLVALWVRYEFEPVAIRADHINNLFSIAFLINMLFTITVFLSASSV